MTEAKAHVPEAVAGVRKLRDMLAEDNPAYAEAVKTEQGADEFCLSVRANLRGERNARKVEQAQLAAQMDMSQSAISKIETASGDVGLKTIYRYANALGMRPVLVFMPAAGSRMIDKAAHIFEESMSQHAVVARAIEDAQSLLVQNLSREVSIAFSELVKGSKV